MAVGNGHATIAGPDADRSSLPGSALKPLVLWTALVNGAIRPADPVLCQGSLRLSGHNLACTHPPTLRMFTASDALAYSCNTYFAQVGRQIAPAALQSGLQTFGLRAPREPDPDRRALVALGLIGEAVTPRALAHAYARLAPKLHESSPAAVAVRSGLANSVRFGMARAAATPGWTVLGKTGTVDDPRPPYQHGWFAAVVSRTGESAGHERVIVVYAPGASGNEAAGAAHSYLTRLAR